MRPAGFAKLIPTPEQTAKAISDLLPQSLPGTLKPGQRNLYEVLARLPEAGVGTKVYQKRWTRKGIEGSTWKITESRLKNNGKNGKAWGLLWWKGEHIGICLCGIHVLSKILLFLVRALQIADTILFSR